ncbi:hypothetical protein PV760_13010 [Paenarthrobacter sp. CC6]|uniref:MFS transporter n=1 Tax=Paenarthrobacter sp. CC6 TaxID=3029184 RepID=UPI00339C4EDB
MSEPLVQSYALSPERRHALYRRTLVVVIVSQIFGGAGLAAGVTVGALLAQQMLGTAGLAGLPAALFTLGSAGAALVVGRLSQRNGRRVGLAAGFIAGGVGATGVVLAAITNNVILLFMALLIYGAGTATNLQARYAGTDLAPAKRRATAISIAMVSTTLGQLPARTSSPRWAPSQRVWAFRTCRDRSSSRPPRIPWRAWCFSFGSAQTLSCSQPRSTSRNRQQHLILSPGPRPQ